MSLPAGNELLVLDLELCGKLGVLLVQVGEPLLEALDLVL